MLAALLRLMLLKVATPFEAATVVVPPRVLEPGFALKVSVTLELVLTVFPFVSWTVTTMAGEMEAPAVTFEGCWVKTS